MVQVSMVPMYPLVLFGGTAMEVLMHRGQFVLSLEEGWMKFITDTHQIAELLKRAQAIPIKLIIVRWD